jgi:hypothetical protein
VYLPTARRGCDQECSGFYSQRGCHHQVFSTGNSNDIHNDMRAVQPLGFGVDITVLDIDLRPHGLQALDMLVYGA